MTGAHVPAASYKDLQSIGHPKTLPRHVSKGWDTFHNPAKRVETSGQILKKILRRYIQ